MLAPPGVAIVLFKSLAGLPHLCQGLLLSSPGYARGIVGAMKNALDWPVSSAEFPREAGAVLNASPRATSCRRAIAPILTTMSAGLIEAASITLPLLGRGLDAAGILQNAELSAQLRAALGQFADAVDAQK